MITQRIAEFAAAEAAKEGLLIKDACLGVGYTGVELSDGSGGACFTFRNDLGPRCGVFARAGKMEGMPASELINMAMSLNLAEASYGVAAINAVLDRKAPCGANALDEMDIRKDDVVGMIGYFQPVVEKFRPRAKKLYIFERNLTAPDLYPDWSEDIYLPQCDVVIITGVTFINKTIDHILELSRNAKEIVIMGASACMAPEILREYGVTLLAGSRVNNASAMLKLISQGGGGVELQALLDKLCVRIAPRRN